MAKLIRRGEKYLVRGKRGIRNGEEIAAEELEVAPPLTKIDEFEYVDESSPYGIGRHRIKIIADSTGKKVAIHHFSWDPAPGYCWEEYWERVTDDPNEIQRLFELKEEEIEEI